MDGGAVPAFRRLDVRTLSPEYVSRLRSAGAGAERTGLASESLGCVATLFIGALVLVVVGVARMVQGEIGVVSILAVVGAVVLLLFALALLKARKVSPLPEFTLTTGAYHLVSTGDCMLEAYCMPLCRGVRFVTHLKNGLYNCTTLEADFGGQSIRLVDVVDAAGRATPWVSSAKFKAFLGLMEGASRALSAGGWDSVPGSNLLPGRPVPLGHGREPHRAPEESFE